VNIPTHVRIVQRRSDRRVRQQRELVELVGSHEFLDFARSKHAGFVNTINQFAYEIRNFAEEFRFLGARTPRSTIYQQQRFLRGGEDGNTIICRSRELK
jgi:hypothetical protein